MSFPDKTWLGCPKGWEDLGQVEKVWDRSAHNGEVYKYETHLFCHTNLHIGKENNKLFKFCPRCLVSKELINETRSKREQDLSRVR